VWWISNWICNVPFVSGQDWQDLTVFAQPSFDPVSVQSREQTALSPRPEGGPGEKMSS
jgi:hypothetical protein